MVGMDGLRALAVIAVLLYHADLGFVQGGFLGVEVFFVISGYLITALLLTEWRQYGRINLKGFWMRRAKRLLPALYVLLVATLCYSLVFLPGEVARLRSDAIAAVGYVTNWYLVLGHQSYFEAIGRPSLLKHLWSLAVEEQFYLLWPPVLALGLSVGARRFRERRMMLIALFGAVGSALLMAALYRPEVDPSRVYYGTDTRATGLLLGAALAFVWTPWAARASAAAAAQEKKKKKQQQSSSSVSSWPIVRLPSGTWRLQLLPDAWLLEQGWARLRRRWGWSAPLVLDVMGLLSLGGLVLLCMKLGEYDPLLYRGGLAAVGLASVVVIMACVHPRTRLLSKTILSQQPLPWIGVRSYGIYLWHWPVFMLSRAHLDVALDGLPLLGLRLVLTVVLAEISYRYVERPIRKGALERGWGRIREARGQGRWRLYALWGGAATALVVMCGVVGVAVASAKPPHPPSYLSTKRLRVEASQAASGADKIAQNAVAQSAAARGGAASAARTTSRESRTGAHRTAAKASGKAAATGTSARAPTVSAVGDSVMLGAVDQLQREIPNLTTIDARGSRQAPEAIGVLRQLRASGQLGDVVIVHIGNNGIFTAGEFDEMMRVLKGVHKVLVVNVTIPDGYSWVPNNKVLAAGVKRYPNKAVLVDWYDASAGHPEYFWDGLHLTPQGARAYADLIATVYRKHAR